VTECPSGTGETTADPLVGSEPDQSLSDGSADAVQDVAFVLDQTSVTGFGGSPGRDSDDAEIETVTAPGAFAATLIV
jgi:hypothetical protein